MRAIRVLGVLLLIAPSAVAQDISQVPEIDPCPTEQVEDISGLADRIDCVEATFMALLRELAASSARGLQGIVDVLGLFERNIQSGVVELPYDDDGIRDVVYNDGPFEAKGIWEGRVDFAVPFSSVPTVHLALRSLDVWEGSTARLMATVVSVDREGFTYHLYTWADTRVYSASASWIAVSQ